MIKCAVEACDREAKARDWCKAHYARWERTGTPGTEAIRQSRPYGMARVQCAATGCNLTEHCKGYCQTHYVRFSQTGDAGGQIRWSKRRAQDHEDGTRTCAGCLERKALSDYLAAPNCERGHRATCRDCCAERDRRRRAEVPDQYAAGAARTQAQRRGAVIVEPVDRDGLRERDGDCCSYCGTTMDFSTRSLNRNTATIDHVLAVVNGGHHGYDNTVLACHSCNSSKRAQMVDAWLPKRLATLSA